MTRIVDTMMSKQHSIQMHSSYDVTIGGQFFFIKNFFEMGEGEIQNERGECMCHHLHRLVWREISFLKGKD